MGSKAAFIGLGNMGYPMAGHLTKAGHEVTVFNRTAAKAGQWVAEYGGGRGETPAEAAAAAEFVFTMVGNDDDLRSVVEGETGVLAGMESGSILIDHTTASAQVERDLSAIAAEKGVGFLDAPVSGGQMGAQNGVLTTMVGGDEATFARAEPMMQAYSKAVTLMGDVGAGQLTKMANQVCAIGVIQGLAEGLTFARKAGLDPERVVDVISKGAAQSWQMDNRSQAMIHENFEGGFACDWMRKDLGIVLDEARRNGSMMPMTALIETFYARIQARGNGRWDNTALVELLSNP